MSYQDLTKKLVIHMAARNDLDREYDCMIGTAEHGENIIVFRRKDKTDPRHTDPEFNGRWIAYREHPDHPGQMYLGLFDGQFDPTNRPASTTYSIIATDINREVANALYQYLLDGTMPDVFHAN